MYRRRDGTLLLYTYTYWYTYSVEKTLQPCRESKNEKNINNATDEKYTFILTHIKKRKNPKQKIIII